MKKIFLLIILFLPFILMGCFEAEDPKDVYTIDIKLTDDGEKYFVKTENDIIYLKVPSSYKVLPLDDVSRLNERLFGANIQKNNKEISLLIYSDIKLKGNRVNMYTNITNNNDSFRYVFNKGQDIVICSTLQSFPNIYDEQKFNIEFYDDEPLVIDDVTLKYNMINKRYSFIESDLTSIDVNGEDLTLDLLDNIKNVDTSELVIKYYANSDYNEEISADEALLLMRNNYDIFASTFDKCGIIYSFIYYTVTDVGGNVTQSEATVYLYDNEAPVVTKNKEVIKDKIELNAGIFKFIHPSALRQYGTNLFRNAGYVISDNAGNVYPEENMKFMYRNDGSLSLTIGDGNNICVFIDENSKCDMSEDLVSSDDNIDFTTSDFYLSYSVGTQYKIAIIQLLHNKLEYYKLIDDIKDCVYDINEINFTINDSEYSSIKYSNSLNSSYIALTYDNDEESLLCYEGTVVMNESITDMKVFIGKNVNMYYDSIINLSETNKIDIYLEYAESEYNEILNSKDFPFKNDYEGCWLYGDRSLYNIHFDYTIKLFEEENNLMK